MDETDRHPTDVSQVTLNDLSYFCLSYSCRIELWFGKDLVFWQVEKSSPFLGPLKCKQTEEEFVVFLEVRYDGTIYTVYVICFINMHMGMIQWYSHNKITPKYFLSKVIWQLISSFFPYKSNIEVAKKKKKKKKKKKASSADPQVNMWCPKVLVSHQDGLWFSNCVIFVVCNTIVLHRRMEQEMTSMRSWRLLRRPMDSPIRMMMVSHSIADPFCMWSTGEWKLLRGNSVNTLKWWLYTGSSVVNWRPSSGLHEITNWLHVLHCWLQSFVGSGGGGIVKHHDLQFIFYHLCRLLITA